jgi:Mn-dependent DtxR family transcriptional regulator
MEWRENELYSIIRREGKIKTVDIVAKANMCKVTALKYLNSLRKKGYIDYELVGPTKLWFTKENENGTATEEILRLLKEIERITGRRAVVILNPEDLSANRGSLSIIPGG